MSKRNELNNVEAALNRKWKQWLKVYKEDAKDGLSVVVEPGTHEERVWNELCELRTQRNNLLTQLRHEGENI